MEKFGEQRIQQNDYYPNDVRWYWSNKRIQVTEPEVAWMPQALFWLGIFTGRCTSGQPEVAKRERKKHAQGSVLNPGLSKWVCINSHPFHPGHYRRGFLKDCGLNLGEIGRQPTKKWIWSDRCFQKTAHTTLRWRRQGWRQRNWCWWKAVCKVRDFIWIRVIAMNMEKSNWI